MIAAIALAFADLADRRVLAVLGRSLLVTLLLFGAIAVGLGWALAGSDPCGWADAGSCVLGAAGGGFGGVLLTLVLLWLLFPAVALGVIAAYMDRVVAAVEARHYPAAAETARPLGAGRGALLGLRSAVRVLVYNLVALPFYLLLLVTGVGPLLLFLAVNGAAFGRDLGEMVAARHDRATGRAWLKASRGDRLVLGAALTALFLVPIANLLAPVLGAAAAAHLYHRRRAA